MYRDVNLKPKLTSCTRKPLDTLIREYREEMNIIYSPDIGIKEIVKDMKKKQEKITLEVVRDDEKYLKVYCMLGRLDSSLKMYSAYREVISSLKDTAVYELCYMERLLNEASTRIVSALGTDASSVGSRVYVEKDLGITEFKFNNLNESYKEKKEEALNLLREYRELIDNHYPAWETCKKIIQDKVVMRKETDINEFNKVCSKCAKLGFKEDSMYRLLGVVEKSTYISYFEILRTVRDTEKADTIMENLLSIQGILVNHTREELLSNNKSKSFLSNITSLFG